MEKHSRSCQFSTNLGKYYVIPLGDSAIAAESAIRLLTIEPELSSGLLGMIRRNPRTYDRPDRLESASGRSGSVSSAYLSLGEAFTRKEVWTADQAGRRI